MNWLDKELTAKESLPEGEAKEMDSDDEEPLEKVDIDPLVFSREEFDAGKSHACVSVELVCVHVYLRECRIHNCHIYAYVEFQVCCPAKMCTL